MSSDGTDRLGFLIHDAHRLLRKRFEARAAGYGLSTAQWRLLARLVKDEGSTQARLAEFLEIEPISVSRLVDRMEASGWVMRKQDAGDRRVRMIFPTEKSRNAFADVKAIAGAIYDEALTGLSSAERRALISGLEKLVDNLGEGETPAAERVAS
jgi:MarR family transcriptional regulator, transcriptional regulator for hemolysin